MSRVLITGSADGLGQMAATLLVEGRHEVTVHARSRARADDALRAVPGAAGALVGDLSSIEQMHSVGEQANATGAFEAVIHNAGVGYRERREETVDGLEHVFAINVLAAYVLSAAIKQPQRLVYLSSGMHRIGEPTLGDLQWRARPWSGSQAYADSKLLDIALAFALARRWPQVLSNALEAGWVATKMGGAGAPDDLDLGARTQAWLAVSEEPAALVSGAYFYHQKPREHDPSADSVELQEGLLGVCAELSGVALGAASA